MSTLYVNNLSTASGSTITVPTGKKIVGTDSGSVEYPNSILQIQDSGTFADHDNSASATWASTNCSVTITPASTSNKILVDLTGVIMLNASSSSNTIMRGSVKIIRTIGATTTNIWNTDEFVEMFQVRNAATEHMTVFHAHFIDSPSTTSQITYTVQSYRHSDANMSKFRFLGSGRGSVMHCREIGG